MRRISSHDPDRLLQPLNLGNDIAKHLPKRLVTDFLIQFFIQEVNWMYEMIYPAAFFEKYYLWWSQPNHYTDDDVQFGLLILRLCLNSLQALPHRNHPTDGVIDAPLAALERGLHAEACKLDICRPRVSSITRVQQLFFHVCYLKNNAEIKDSWFVLSDAVKEAHELGLHLDDTTANSNEFELEIRRRVFWNLYIWDR